MSNEKEIADNVSLSVKLAKLIIAGRGDQIFTPYGHGRYSDKGPNSDPLSFKPAPHKEDGDNALSAGKYEEALGHYYDALTYFDRYNIIAYTEQRKELYSLLLYATISLGQYDAAKTISTHLNSQVGFGYPLPINEGFINSYAYLMQYSQENVVPGTVELNNNAEVLEQYLQQDGSPRSLLLYKTLSKAHRAMGNNKKYLELSAKATEHQYAGAEEVIELFYALQAERYSQSGLWSDLDVVARNRTLLKDLDPGMKTSLRYTEKMGKIGATFLAEHLKTNTTLTHLYISYTKIGSDEAAAIAEALKTNITLTNLDISHNQIGPDGASAIAKALETNKALTSLDISKNNMGDDEAAAIAEALKTNITLTNLDISHNQIGDDGASAIAEALKTNKALTSLNVRHNQICLDGAAAIAEALKTNTTLTQLDIECNKIGQGMRAMTDLIKSRVAANKDNTLKALEYSSLEIKSDELMKKFLQFAPTLLKWKQEGIATLEEIAEILNMDGDTSQNVYTFRKYKTLLSNIQSNQQDAIAALKSFIKSHATYKTLADKFLATHQDIERIFIAQPHCDHEEQDVGHEDEVYEWYYTALGLAEVGSSLLWMLLPEFL